MENFSKAIASMSMGIVSCSFAIIAIVLSFFTVLYGGILTGMALALGILAIVFSCSSLHCGRAVAGLVTGIVGSSISGVTLMFLMVICFFF